LDCGSIAVELPVTRQPPHRSRRAVFSHRALQEYSLPQSGSSQRSRLSRLWPSYNPWLFYSEVLQEFLEPLPVETAPLAAPIEPFEQYPQCLPEKLIQTGIVTHDPVVVEIPTEFGVQPPEQYHQPQIPILPAPRRKTFQRCFQLLARGSTLEVRSSPSVFTPVELEPQEVEPRPA